MLNNSFSFTIKLIKKASAIRINKATTALMMLEAPNQLSMVVYSGIPESGRGIGAKNTKHQHTIAKAGNKMKDIGLLFLKKLSSIFV